VRKREREREMKSGLGEDERTLGAIDQQVRVVVGAHRHWEDLHRAAAGSWCTEEEAAWALRSTLTSEELWELAVRVWI
jgi:hypothetical protein